MMCMVWILITFLAWTSGLPKPASDVSALSYHSGRPIIGGTPAENIIPYMVAITEGLRVRKFVCGGSLVTVRTILTAAHCLDGVFSHGYLNSSLRAIVGTKRWNVGGINYRIAKNITHPNYVRKIGNNDIALLITTARVELSDSVRTVSLYFGFIGPNVETKVTGWGRTESGAQPESLQQLIANTVDGERCKAKVSEVARKFNIHTMTVQPHIQLCTFHSKDHGLCGGDSGSPLVLVNTLQQIGIVSWGVLCAVGAPDVFVRISAYKSWLERNIL